MSVDVYRQQGFGHRLGISGVVGLLVIDFTVGFADPETFGGGNIAEAITKTVPVLEFARVRRWPVAHTKVAHAAGGADANVFTLKVPSLLDLTPGCPSGEIVPDLAPAPDELVISKNLPSAFFGTTLAAWLTFRRVETLVIAGCTTSGCVRASVVDAMSHGFKPIVLADCVGDRALAPHEANLFDMAQKYADVVSAAEMMAEVESLAGVAPSISG